MREEDVVLQCFAERQVRVVSLVPVADDVVRVVGVLQLLVVLEELRRIGVV